MSTYGGEPIKESILRPMRLRCVRRGCDPKPISEREALHISGMTERALLLAVYQTLADLRRSNHFDSAGYADVGRRLGMSPPIFPTETFDKSDIPDVLPAIDRIAREALPATPIIDEQRVQAEYPLVKKVWRSRGLWSGSSSELLNVLSQNMTRDKQVLAGFKTFNIDVLTSQLSLQINTIFQKGSVFVGLRIWRTHDRIFLCGHKKTILPRTR